MSKWKLMVFAVLMAGSTVACAQTGRVVESEKAVSSLREMADQLTIAQSEIDKIVIAMDELNTTNDLQSAFKSYRKSVAEIQAARKRAKAQRANMQAKSGKYIAKWQMELETIQDVDVKAALVQRKEKVAADFGQIRSSMDNLRDAYQPLLISVLEIRKALALDLNSAGVISLGSAMNKAKAQGEIVKQKIKAVRLELEAIAGSLSPSVDAK